MLKHISLILILIGTISRSNCTLELVQDDELLNLVKTERYVIVLFTRKHCDLCDKYEKELTNLREDIVETLNSWVVKVIDSQMTRLYSTSKEPVLVFFRHGVPLLYDGPLNDEHILHILTDNKEPVVKELTDDTFEHLTQASTGATTGDWFVMFYTVDCAECGRMQARWETVGAKLKTRMNVARVNKATTGAATARRFGVFHVPAFILFRQGKMYRYEVDQFDITSLVSFAQDWYKNAKAEKVPIPKSPFDDFVTMMYDHFSQLPDWYKICLFVIFIGGFAASFLYILFPSLFRSKSSSGKTSEQKKKKKKVSKD